MEALESGKTLLLRSVMNDTQDTLLFQDTQSFMQEGYAGPYLFFHRLVGLSVGLHKIQ